MDELNPLFKSLLETEKITSDISFFRFVNNAAAGNPLSSAENDIYRRDQKFPAKVFDAWEEGGDNANPGNFWGFFAAEGGVEGKLVMVKALILRTGDKESPDAGTFADPDTVPSDMRVKAINALPTFVAKFPDMKVPDIGTNIWVDFRNKKHFKHPRYLGIMHDAQLTTIAPPTLSSQNAFNQGVPSTFPTGRKSNFVIPKVSGDVALLLGDSQMVGHVGSALSAKLKSLGYAVVPSNRKLTSRVGAPIRLFLQPGCTPHKRGWGNAGFNCILPYLTAANKPKVVYINLSGNGGTGAQAVELINRIRGATGTTTPIVWILAPRAWNGRLGKAVQNEGPARGNCPGDSTKTNCGRIARNEAIKRAIQGLPSVTIIDPQAELPDYQAAESTDGLHMGASGAKRLVNKIS